MQPHWFAENYSNKKVPLNLWKIKVFACLSWYKRRLVNSLRTAWYTEKHRPIPSIKHFLYCWSFLHWDPCSFGSDQRWFLRLWFQRNYPAESTRTGSSLWICIGGEEQWPHEFVCIVRSYTLWSCFSFKYIWNVHRHRKQSRTLRYWRKSSS